MLYIGFHGLEGLRVIDVSIFPIMTSNNINAPTMMVAKKGADLALGIKNAGPKCFASGQVAKPVRSGLAAVIEPIFENARFSALTRLSHRAVHNDY